MAGLNSSNPTFLLLGLLGRPLILLQIPAVRRRMFQLAALAFLTRLIESEAALPTEQVPFSEWVPTQWRTSSGLPGSDPSALLQTADGYLWVGTESGWVKFDGYDFRPPADGVAPSHQTSAVTTMVPDGGAGFWIGTKSEGLLHFDGQRSRAFGLQQGLVDSRILALAHDGQEGVFAATENSRVFRWQQGRFVELELSGQAAWPRGDAITALWAESEKSLWIGTSKNGLFHWQEVEGNPRLRHPDLGWNQDEPTWR